MGDQPVCCLSAGLPGVTSVEEDRSMPNSNTVRKIADRKAGATVPVDLPDPTGPAVPPTSTSIPVLSREAVLSKPHVATMELNSAQFNGKNPLTLLKEFDLSHCVNDTNELDWMADGTMMEKGQERLPCNPILDANHQFVRNTRTGFMLAQIFNDTLIVQVFLDETRVTPPFTEYGQPRIKGRVVKGEKTEDSFVSEMRNLLISCFEDAKLARELTASKIHLGACSELGKMSKALKEFMAKCDAGDESFEMHPNMKITWQRYQFFDRQLQRIRRETKKAQDGKSTEKHLKVLGRNTLDDSDEKSRYFVQTLRCDLSECYAEDIRKKIKDGALARKGLYITEFDISMDWAAYLKQSDFILYMVEKGHARLQKDFGLNGDRAGLTSSKSKKKDDADEPKTVRYSTAQVRDALANPYFYSDKSLISDVPGHTESSPWKEDFGDCDPDASYCLLDNANKIGKECTSYMYSSPNMHGIGMQIHGFAIPAIRIPMRGKPMYNKDAAQYEHRSNTTKNEPGSHTLPQAAAMFDRTQRGACSENGRKGGHSRTEVTAYFTGIDPDRAHLYMYDSLEHMRETLEVWDKLIPNELVVEMPRSVVFDNYAKFLQHILVTVDTRSDTAHLVYSVNQLTKFIAGSPIKNWSKSYRWVLQMCAWRKLPIDLLELHTGDSARKSVEEEAREVAAEEGTKKGNDGLRKRRDVQLQLNLASNATNNTIPESFARAAAKATTASETEDVSAPPPPPSSDSVLGKRTAHTVSERTRVEDRHTAKWQLDLDELSDEDDDEEETPLESVEPEELQEEAFQTMDSIPPQDEYEPPEFVQKAQEQLECDNASTMDASDDDRFAYAPGWIPPKERGGCLVVVSRYIPMPRKLSQTETKEDGTLEFMPETRLVLDGRKTGFVHYQAPKNTETAVVVRQTDAPEPAPTGPVRRRTKAEMQAAKDAFGDQPIGSAAPPGWNADGSHIDDVGVRVIDKTIKEVALERLDAGGMAGSMYAKITTFPPCPISNGHKQYAVKQLKTTIPINVAPALSKLYQKKLAPSRIEKDLKDMPSATVKGELAKLSKRALFCGITEGNRSRAASIVESLSTVAVEADVELQNEKHYLVSMATKSMLRDELLRHNSRGQGLSGIRIPFGTHELIAVQVNQSIETQIKTGATVTQPKYCFYLKIESGEFAGQIMPYLVPDEVCQAWYMYQRDLKPLLNEKATPGREANSYVMYLSPLIDGIDFHKIGHFTRHEPSFEVGARAKPIITIDVSNPSPTSKEEETIRIIDAGKPTRPYDSVAMAAALRADLFVETNADVDSVVELPPAKYQRQTKLDQFTPETSMFQLVLCTDNTTPKLPSIVKPLDTCARNEFQPIQTLIKPFIEPLQLVIIKVLEIGELQELTKSRKKVDLESEESDEPSSGKKKQHAPHKGYASRVKLTFPNGLQINKTGNMFTCILPDTKLVADLVAKMDANNNFLIVKSVTAKGDLRLNAELVPEKDLWWRRIEMAQPAKPKSSYEQLPSIWEKMTSPPTTSCIVVDRHRIVRDPKSSPIIILFKDGIVMRFKEPHHVQKLKLDDVVLPCKFNFLQWRLEAASSQGREKEVVATESTAGSSSGVNVEEDGAAPEAEVAAMDTSE